VSTRTAPSLPIQDVAGDSTELPRARPRALDAVVGNRTTLDEAAELEQTARLYGMEHVDLRDMELDSELLAQFPAAELFRHNMIPLGLSGHVVRIATGDPLDIEGLDELSSRTGLLLKPVLASRTVIEELLRSRLGLGAGTLRDIAGRFDEDDSATEQHVVDDDESGSASVIKLVNEILQEAVRQRASDIHFEPTDRGLEVRYRVDGVLRRQPAPEEIHRLRAAILSRLKIMARLNIAEKRLPQDGRIPISVAGRDLDLRVAIMPLLHGEGAVLRLLDMSRGAPRLDELHMPVMLRERWVSAIRQPNGLILVTGPTGSGKTSTLYASLAELNDGDSKIVTIEDPVEYQLHGVSQIQAKPKIGLTFAAGLRGVLRLDPDVILVGEIRDPETAQSAVQASLTGHVVFSTLHTNDAAGAVPRLVDMGVEPYLVAGVLRAVLGQRLVRHLCPACRQPAIPDLGTTPADFPLGSPTFRSVGCRECRGTGYFGRIGVFELLTLDARLRDLAGRGVGADDFRRQALASGYVPLRAHGWRRVADGETTIDEVLRVCADV
jgi:type II secretory ATPase GspE/PulE/Tfp pilus assembly ATPase PilB-like protein